MPYIGTSPSNGVRRVHTYTATASQTTFTGASSEGVTLSYADTNYIDVFQNGVLLGSADYTSTSGTSVVLTQACSADDLLVVIVYDIFSVADTVSKTNGGSFDSAVTMSGGILGNTTFSGEIITSTSGTSNVRIGENAGDAIASGGTQNTVIGDDAGTAITTADACTAIGHNALATNTTSSYNTAVGHDALASATGTYNTAIGPRNSGDSITSGSKNTIIGDFNGNQGGLDIRTSSNNIVLSDGDGNVRQHTDGINGVTHWTTNMSDSDRVLATGSHTIHSDVSANVALFVENSSANPFGIFIDFSDTTSDNNSNYFLKCEDGSDTGRLVIFSDGDVVNHDNAYGAISDEKLKEQITDATSQWEDIKALTVRKYKMKSDVATGDSDAHWRLGVIAQEVETAGMNGLVKDNPDMIENEDGEIVEGETSTKSVKYSILYMKAIKALQEAMTRIETLEAKVTALENAE